MVYFMFFARAILSILHIPLIILVAFLIFYKNKKLFLFLVAIVVAICAIGEFRQYLYRKENNIIATSQSAYGFAYENGYSSSDLSPYYVENEFNRLAKLDDPATFTISDPLEMPILDGAEAAYPVYSAFANACYEGIADIQSKAKYVDRYGANANMEGITYPLSVMRRPPIQFSNTVYAYEKLIDGKVDIVFGAKPSQSQIQMANDYGKKVILTPIGKEGFVFFVNEENPINELSSEQIRAIYSDEITNWNQVGGEDKSILAYQRPENSGSQTMMEYFMGNTPLKAPLRIEYNDSMLGVINEVAAYDNGNASIGYSFRYFASIMAGDIDESSDNESGGVKFLAIDGVYPDEETIRSGEYPLSTELYAITAVDRSGTYSKDTIEPFLKWMTGPQGQQIVADTGYVSLK